MRHHFISAALDGAVAIFSRAFVVETGIVGLKPAVEARGVGFIRVKDDRANKRRRPVSVRSQDFRSVGQIRRQGAGVIFQVHPNVFTRWYCGYVPVSMVACEVVVSGA